MDHGGKGPLGKELDVPWSQEEFSVNGDSE